VSEPLKSGWVIVRQALARRAAETPRRFQVNSDLFLNAIEVFDLTGYRLAKYQVAWLRRRGWRFETNAAGAPRVARAYFERKMVGEAR
jgi:hypothetical protein